MIVERNAKVRIAVIVCAAVATAFLTAFFVMFGVWRSRVKSRNENDRAVYSATCADLGEIAVSRDTFCRYDSVTGKYVGIITVNGTEVDITRGKVDNGIEDAAYGHFVYGETEYLIVVHWVTERLYGALYYDADGLPTFIEKLVFCP